VAVAIVIACGLVIMGRLSTHSFGPLSALLFVIWYIVFFKWVMPFSDDSTWSTWWSMIKFYPKAFAALLVLIFILHVRRAELDADQ
jgi:hypothetical protein